MKVYQIDFVASRNQIYWSDSDMNAVKRANLSASTVKVLIDTGKIVLLLLHFFLIFITVFKSELNILHLFIFMFLFLIYKKEVFFNFCKNSLMFLIFFS